MTPVGEISAITIQRQVGSFWIVSRRYLFTVLPASDVPFRSLHRSVAKKKLNLFELASASVRIPLAIK
jgi:hypothetical protein